MTKLEHLTAGKPPDSNYLQLEIPAVPEQVSQARHTLADFLRRHSWKRNDADDLLLAVGEACSNAVNYGGRGFAAPCVHITCQPLGNHSLQVEVKNQGNGFHPDLAVYGQMPEADLFSVHGRGFGLILALVDQVQVLSDGENTIIRLTKSKTD